MNKMNLIYAIKNGEVEITGCNKGVTEVEIPAEIQGYPVKTIGEYAFNGCKNLVSVILPKGLRHIGHKAFYDCLALTSIYIPNSVIKIGPLAFGWCLKLSEIDFPLPNKECRVDITSGLPLRKCIDGNWRV